MKATENQIYLEKITFQLKFLRRVSNFSEKRTKTVKATNQKLKKPMNSILTYPFSPSFNSC